MQGQKVQALKGKTKKEREAEMIYQRLFADLSTGVEYREATEINIQHVQKSHH